MKILITSDWYEPVINGVVTSVLNLKNGLEKRGHEVKILTLSQNNRSYENDGVIYIGSIDAGIVYPNARLKVAVSGKWEKEIICWKPDIVHSNCEFCTFPLAKKIAKELNIPLLHTYHTVYENYTHYFSPNKKWGCKLAVSFSRKICAKTDGIIAPTEKVERLLRNYGIEKPVYVVPTGIDYKKYQNNNTVRNEIRERWKIPSDVNVLLFVGRLAKEKNCEELLQMMKALNKRKVILMIVGDGPYKDALKEKVGLYGIGDKVIFTGMVLPKEITAYYQLGDVFVSASTSETQGLTYLEAIASGLVMICKKDACLEKLVINDKNGWQYTDINDFVQKIQSYMDSEELQEKLHQGALQKRQRYSIEAFAEKMEQVYMGMMEKRGSSA